MRCKNYSECRNVTPSPTGHKCWETWQLCGDCAVAKYPEEYPLLKKIQKASPFWSRRNKVTIKGKVFYRGIKEKQPDGFGRNARYRQHDFVEEMR
tara:strand:- start:1008 stop:1292 length:285 start_codon:yes stop_codon:yes gene_type:complete